MGNKFSLTEIDIKDSIKMENQKEKDFIVGILVGVMKESS